ncbi:MAG: DNA gyrase modulator, partial [Actinomycetota bacterium]
MSHLSDLAKMACEAARRAGADAADAYLTTSRRLSVDIFNRKPESFEKADGAGAGIRVWRDTATGYAYTTALSAAGMVEAAQSAVDNAAAADGDE